MSSFDIARFLRVLKFFLNSSISNTLILNSPQETLVLSLVSCSSIYNREKPLFANKTESRSSFFFSSSLQFKSSILVFL